MSKAFTKEQDGDGPDEQDDALDDAGKMPAGVKNYITPGGAQRLRTELHELLTVLRPEVVRTVSWAASNGDRSENGDYIYGKRRLREIDRRIRFLTKRLEAAEVVDPTKQATDRVLFGARVTLLCEDDSKKVITIVGIDETDPGKGKVSWISPIAKALLNSKQGDVVQLFSPKGEEDLEVLKIEYLEVI